MFRQLSTVLRKPVLLVVSMAVAGGAFAHGNVTPQKIDTSVLPAVVGEPLSNPYRGNSVALTVGQNAYAQNCARCHGIDVVSGGIAPDLRYLPTGDEGDEYFIDRARNGVVRNGTVYMPAFKEVLGEPGMWAIRTYLESKHEE